LLFLKRGVLEVILQWIHDNSGLGGCPDDFFWQYHKTNPLRTLTAQPQAPSTEIVEYLLMEGADPTVECRPEDNVVALPIFLAVPQNNPLRTLTAQPQAPSTEIVEYLLMEGADPTVECPPEDHVHF
jgi:hypothetical protein